MIEAKVQLSSVFASELRLPRGHVATFQSFSFYLIQSGNHFVYDFQQFRERQCGPSACYNQCYGILNPLPQIPNTPQHPCRSVAFASPLPCTILPLLPKSFSRFLENLLHKSSTPNHRPIRKVSHPATQHFTHRHISPAFQLR